MLLKILSTFVIATIAIFFVFVVPNQVLCQEKLATVTISTNPDTAKISIDGNVVGYSPVKGITITIGKHTIKAEKPGYISYKKEYEISSGENLIEIELEKSKITPTPCYKKPLVWGFASAAIIGAVIYFLIPNGGEKSKDLQGPPAPPPGI